VTRGLVFGKFLPYHAGHAYLIRSARAAVDELTVLVCTLQREPIDGALRHAWVAASHPDCIVRHVAEEVPQTPDEHPDFWAIWVDLIRRHAGSVDVVFTSEHYGDALAFHLGARHVCVDRPRATYPVSGSAVRTDPIAQWEFIPPAVRPWYVRRVAIVGAESTGKTTLAARLADAFSTVWVAEFGRGYCEGIDPRTLALADFDAIGRGQLEAEDGAAAQANRMLICDTELHTTCTWSEMIAGTTPPWLAEQARARRYDLVLLLADDVPWVDDGTRVLADRRREHTERLRAALTAAGQPYVELRGPFEGRLREAIAHVRALATSLATPP
jgi:HTH-type transcriptional regulator, transcriptional repressor of NAD biosynthesis genes